MAVRVAVTVRVAVVCVARRAAAPTRRMLQMVQQQHGQKAAHKHQTSHALWQARAVRAVVVVVRCAAAVVVVAVRLNLAVLMSVVGGLRKKAVL